ncbi:2Fe-2S iron-sulfur cluster binding domain-containing protein [Aquabacterium sp. CECT 9606]|uniref:2Fe-2S iron-sulfur cluster-binding protein n=1 Tax=Aquabacterium sp. CECT 9606 TaxID=2845822 RepID=UPI001E3C4A7A|nr:2Fe-2S iron-sulfur cluster binding domain-containing protein [Aquabacterium sp. CECT 9606]CAH0353215.1 Xylene monooxygenase electron transfer component [Aquabacterium sp. CECT 9606]
MFSFFTKPRAVTALINDVVITVRPKETLLQAALREGIDFPHSCRVGGCATCKCQLVEGKVKELTQAGYILSDDELDRGFILACQSVPSTNVRIKVDTSHIEAHRKVSGRVVGQERLTHDIVHLRIQLDESLPYKAGQFAQLSVQDLPGVARSFSFATRVQPNSQVSFFVRKVPDGVFTSHVHAQSLVSSRVSVEGPGGNFWLRPASAPLLLIAGGSGLAPILALLQEALHEGVKRPATLIFGARTQADLYALEDIGEISRRWPEAFTFLPILSQEPEPSSWTGRLGLVTDLIPERLRPGCHAYLCGPPAMIDAVTALLLQHGVDRAHIHADRFTTQHDVSAAA